MEPLHSVAFSPDGKMLLAGGTDKGIFGQLVQNFFGISDKRKTPSVWLWDLNNGNLLQEYTSHADDVNAVGFFPDGKGFVSGGDDKRVGVMELSK
jgi:hypothetical protein